jgi:hypothetical protein
MEDKTEQGRRCRVAGSGLHEDPEAAGAVSIIAAIGD